MRRPHTRGGEPEQAPTMSETNNVVPTRVGVNRRPGCAGKPQYSRPHTRGGEPEIIGVIRPTETVVPTRVGVNRFGRPSLENRHHVVPTRVGVSRIGR